MFNKIKLIQYPLNKEDKKYTLPESTTEIEKYAFYGNEKLHYITFNEQLATINEYSFGKMNDIRTITLPKSIKTIQPNSFNGCEKLKTVFYKSKEVSWNRIGLGGGNGSLEQCLIVYEYE